MSVLGKDEIRIFEKLHELIKSSNEDHNHGDDPIFLQRRLHEQRDLLEQLDFSVRKVEDARKVLETRQKNLITENEELKETLSNEEDKTYVLSLKCKTMLQNNEKFIRMKEKYQTMCKAVKEENLKKEITTKSKSTSCSNLVCVDHKYTQAWLACPSCGDEKRGGPSVRLTRSELDRLENDMQALKSVLHQREATWCKLAERERLQRIQITRFNTELESLREVAQSRQEELEYKTQAVQELKSQLDRHRLESTALRKHISKLERREKEYSDLYEINMDLYLKKWLQQHKELDEVSSIHSGKRSRKMKSSDRARNPSPS